MVLLRLLGAVEIADGSGWRRAGAPKQCCVLAALALSHGRSLSGEVLANRVWGGEVPRASRGVIYGHVTRLRGLLEQHTEISLSRASADGYRLDIPPERIDLFLMRSLVSRARAAADNADPELAATLWRDAVKLWRGRALSGVDGSWAQRVRAKLHSEYVEVVTGRYDTELALGRHAEVVGELEELVDAHPLAERLMGQLMLALYRCDRPSEALTRFTEARNLLKAQRGTEPTAQLTQLQRRMLRHDPSLRLIAGDAADGPVGTAPTPRTDAVPAQLPADIPTFTGRMAELEVLTGPVAPSPGGASGTVVVSAVDGMAGIGKTALAVHAAVSVAKRFPDGQLFIDLHGFTEGAAPVPPADALARLIRSLGVAESEIPGALDDRAAAYRTALAGRRMLILLDNAADEAQVRPLLPGNSGCLVLITSRRRLPGLDDVTSVSLDVLDVDEAVELFVESCGRRIERESVATVTEIVQLCGRLPLAVRIAAARLRNRAMWTVEQLRDRIAGAQQLLGELAVGQRSVAAAFEMSYQSLDADHRRVFRLLGLIPGTTFHLEAVAALTAEPIRRAERLLEDLVDAHLVSICGPRRYRLHDLVREYVGEAALKHETADGRDGAVRRLYSWYLHSGHTASNLGLGHDAKLKLPDLEPGAFGSTFDGAESARRWIDAERENLPAVCGQAAEHGCETVAWGLPALLCKYFTSRADCDTALRLAQLGMLAAERQRSACGQARMRFELAQCAAFVGDHQAAAAEYQIGLEHAGQSADRAVERALHVGISGARYELGQLAEAANHCERAMAIEIDADHDQRASVSNMLGIVCMDSGRLREAAKYLGQAEALLRDQDNPHLLIVMTNLVLVHLDLGDLPRASHTAHEAFRLGHDVGFRKLLASLQADLARVELALGRPDSALSYANQALDTVAESGVAQVEPFCRVTLAMAKRNEPGEAVASAERAVERARTLGVVFAHAEGLVVLAQAHLSTGDPRQARDYAEQALELARGREFAVIEGNAVTTMVAIQHALDDHDKALHSGKQALDNHRGTGHRPGQARTHLALADIHLAAGRPESGGQHLRDALQLYSNMGAPDAESVRRRLQLLTG